MVTPHNTGGAASHADHATALFCENLRRYSAGEPLENVVATGG
jgi:phosphoglycerate dehydrogenase-like enzyme